MTKPKSKQRPPLINQTLEKLDNVPPLELKNAQSIKRLRDLIRKAFGNGELPYEIEGIEHRLLVAANKSRIIYKANPPRQLAQLRTQLETVEKLAPALIDATDSIEKNNLIRAEHWEATTHEFRENAEIDLELYPAPHDVADLKQMGCDVFEPEMIEKFPLQSARYGLDLLLHAARIQLSALEDYDDVSIADRPETEVIAHAIREIRKDACPEEPNYIGSEGGSIDNLYSFLCDLAGFEPGCALSTLRKPYSFPQLHFPRVLPWDEVLNSLKKKK